MKTLEFAFYLDSVVRTFYIFIFHSNRFQRDAPLDFTGLFQQKREAVFLYATSSICTDDTHALFACYSFSGCNISIVSFFDENITPYVVTLTSLDKMVKNFHFNYFHGFQQNTISIKWYAGRGIVRQRHSVHTFESFRCKRFFWQSAKKFEGKVLGSK